eukprot:jgi/Astpho2/8314/e_gw1.00122.186.1_t
MLRHACSRVLLSQCSPRSVSSLPIVHHEAYSAPILPQGHRFPMAVFQSIYNMLLEENIAQTDQVFRPPSLPTDEQLLLVHTPDYLHQFLSGTLPDSAARQIGFGRTTAEPILIERTQAEVAGTLLTAQLALEHGLACNTAGGTHHAFPGRGTGFCILNDMAVTAKCLLQQGAVQRVMTVDLDVHQGDGTAVCLQDEPQAFTLSVHSARNFPSRKQQSDLDIPLPDGVCDEEYMRMVATTLPGLLQDFRPNLVIYDAGIDPHMDDALGRLALTDDGLRRRDLLVLDTCLAQGIPVAGLVGGGYHHDLHTLADRHCWLHRAAAQMWRDYRL